jgi:hypothetical protein
LIVLCAAVAALFIAVAFATPRPALAVGGVTAATPEPTPTPGRPAKIVFDPPTPNVLPGIQLTITATALDSENRRIEGGEYKYELADPEHNEFIMLRPVDDDSGKEKAKGRRLVVSGTFNTGQAGAGEQKAGRVRPTAAPIIVVFTKGGTEVRKVLDVSLTNGGRTPGPIPPGLKPQVDVMWSVLPGRVVHANFGRKVRGDYYGIQIVIGNNSGYDLQIASAGFTLKNSIPTPSGVSYPLPTASYQLARGSLAREQEVGFRARLVNSLDAVGPVLTGFVPFFHIINHRANFSQLVNVFTNPFSAGTKLVYPDTTIGQLGRLEQQTFRNDQTSRTIIPNNTQISIVTFFPKESLKRYMQAMPGFKKDDLSDPMKVMEALGDLVLVGQQVEYLNRVRLTGDAVQRDTFTISGRVTDGCNNGLAGVSVTLSGGTFFKEPTPVTTNAEGAYLFEKVPGGDEYKVTATLAGFTFTNEGGDSFKLEGDRTSVNFRGKQEKRTISGKVTDADGKGIEGVTVKVDGSDKKTTTASDGSYSLTGLEPITYDVSVEKTGVTFTGENKTHHNIAVEGCNQIVNFTGTKTATPTPTPTPTP